MQGNAKWERRADVDVRKWCACYCDFIRSNPLDCERRNDLFRKCRAETELGQRGLPNSLEDARCKDIRPSEGDCIDSMSVPGEENRCVLIPEAAADISTA